MYPDAYTPSAAGITTTFPTSGTNVNNKTMLSKTDLFKLQLAGCIILDISASGMCRNFWLANTYYVNDKYSGAYKTYVPKAGELQITSMGGSAHEKERDDWREHVRLVKDL